MGGRPGVTPPTRRLLVALIGAAVVAACATPPVPSQVASSVPAATVTPSAPPTPSSSRSAPPSPLAGTAWTAVLVVGRTPVPGKEPTATFTTERIRGTGGCNDYDGPYEEANGVFSIPEFVWSAVGCNGAMGEIERLFDIALRGASSASIDPAGRLVIDGSGGSITFVAAPQSRPS